jgi:hypothetical protein
MERTAQGLRDEAAVAGDLALVRIIDLACGNLERLYRGRRISARTATVASKRWTRAAARRYVQARLDGRT